MRYSKEGILKAYKEIELTEFKDFKIKSEYVTNYEIIDIHTHLFKGLEKLYPKLLRRESKGMNTSFFNKSCYPLSLKAFDLNEVTYTKYPTTLKSIEGIRAKIKFTTGAFVLNKATPERLIRDMLMNNISKSLVLQISPPNDHSGYLMEKVTDTHKELLTFGSIHPEDSDIEGKIKTYLKLNIKGWKINPHVCKFIVNEPKSIELFKRLAETKLPILTCSGLPVPKQLLKTRILSKKQKEHAHRQDINLFYDVLDELTDVPFIFAHAGLFEIDELIKIMKKYPTTYTDISVQSIDNIKKLIKEIGSERILFGTDYPFMNQALTILTVLRATKNEEDRKNIFGKNAKRLLSL